MLKTLLVMLVAIFVSACASTPRTEVVTDVQIRPIIIPDTLLTKCNASRPPNKEQYIKASIMIKEDLLTNYAIALLKDIEVCNQQITAIKFYQAKQLEVLLNAKK